MHKMAHSKPTREAPIVFAHRTSDVVASRIEVFNGDVTIRTIEFHKYKLS